MIRRWFYRLIGAWYRLRDSVQANPVSPLWLKQQAQTEARQATDWQYVNWQAMKDLNRE